MIMLNAFKRESKQWWSCHLKHHGVKIVNLKTDAQVEQLGTFELKCPMHRHRTALAWNADGFPILIWSFFVLLYFFPISKTTGSLWVCLVHFNAHWLLRKLSIGIATAYTCKTGSDGGMGHLPLAADGEVQRGMQEGANVMCSCSGWITRFLLRTCQRNTNWKQESTSQRSPWTSYPGILRISVKTNTKKKCRATSNINKQRFLCVIAEEIECGYRNLHTSTHFHGE